MRSNKPYRATLMVISLLSLAEIAAAQAGQTRRDPVDSGEEKIVVNVRAAADAPADKSDRATLALIPLLSLAETAAAQAEQTRSDPVDNSEEKIVVNVWAEADTPAEEQLSRRFAAAGLRATTLLREWQRHIAYNIRIGLPLCASCIAADRDQAAEALRLATLLASTDVSGGEDGSIVAGPFETTPPRLDGGEKEPRRMVLGGASPGCHRGRLNTVGCTPDVAVAAFGHRKRELVSRKKKRVTRKRNGFFLVSSIRGF